MPIYEYQCTKCEKITEIMHGISEKPKRKCPKCGGKLTRLISLNSFHLKGTGWYKTDYASSDGNGKNGKPAKESTETKETTDAKDTKGTETSSTSSASESKSTEKKEKKKSKESSAA